MIGNRERDIRSPEMPRRQCHMKFESRNALFRHLDRENLIVRSEDDNTIN